ncbi:MAG: tetratricopeptide repeat protein [Pseudomonadota bacterium]
MSRWSGDAGEVRLVGSDAPMPVRPEQRFARAVACFRAGRLNDARTELGALLAVRPQDVSAFELMARIAKQQGDLLLATRSLEAALVYAPERAGLWVSLGLVARQRGQLRAALTAFEGALSRAPDHVAALVNRANLLCQMRRFSDAIADYRAALRIEPGAVTIYANLASLLESQGRLKTAAAVLRRGIERCPDARQHWTLILAAARLERRGNKRSRALRRLESLVQDGLPAEGEVRAYLELGYGHDDAGNTAAAMRAFKRANQLQLRAMRPHVRRTRLAALCAHERAKIPALADAPRTVVGRDDVASPIFVFGFPGSGCHYLGAMLSAAGVRNLGFERARLAAVAAARERLDTHLTSIQCRDLRAMMSLRDDGGTGAADVASTQPNLVEVAGLGALYAPLCYELFPDARYIEVHRPDDDTLLTALTQPYLPGDTSALLLRPADARGALHAWRELWTDARQRFGLRVLDVDFETLLQPESGVWHAVCDWLGLDEKPFPRRLDPLLADDRGFPPGQAAHYQDWLQQF